MTTMRGNTFSAESSWFRMTSLLYQKAWNEQKNHFWERSAAKVAFVVFPIILAVMAFDVILALSLKVKNICYRVVKQPGRLPGYQNSNRRTSRTLTESGAVKIQLEKGSSQYDIRAEEDPHDNHPPACTFHALAAIAHIRQNFDKIVKAIQNGDVDALSQMQRQCIRSGLRSYNQALGIHAANFKEGANLEDLQKHYPSLLQSLRLNFENPGQDNRSVEVRTESIATRLFSSNQGRAVLLKNGNEESFAVIYDKSKAIIFDSHAREILLTSTTKQLQEELVQKLKPFSQWMGNYDAVPFSSFFTS